MLPALCPAAEAAFAGDDTIPLNLRLSYHRTGGKSNLFFVENSVYDYDWFISKKEQMCSQSESEEYKS